MNKCVFAMKADSPIPRISYCLRGFLMAYRFGFEKVNNKFSWGALLINENRYHWQQVSIMSFCESVMYVCVCKAVTDQQVVHAIEQGACTRRQLMQCTGAGGVCGKCSPSLKSLLDEKSAGEERLQAA
ncbi:MAG: (2Fe-2S)-binding protein [Gammaproteobacteria bacterium]